MTARHLLAAADSLSVTLANDAQLASVASTQLDTTGKGGAWSYVYYSFNTNPLDSKRYTVIAENEYVSCHDSGGPPGYGAFVLMNRWMDSDSALLIAQRAGGSDMPRRFPECIIRADLIQEPAPPFRTEWLISYMGKDTTRRVDINAATGDVIGWTSIVASVAADGNPALPKVCDLEQNYPNPFNPSTTIRYALPSRTHVTLTIFNTLGQQVVTLVNEVQDAGYHDVRFDGTNLSSGVYFYRIVAGTYVESKKLVILR
jgi:hypothetical protein